MFFQNFGKTRKHCNFVEHTRPLVESLWAGAIIGDGGRKFSDPRAPMILDNFAVFSEQIISARIHAHVVGSRADVFMTDLLADFSQR